MKLEIITPERNVFSGDVDVVTLPGLNGQFQVLKDHAPMVSTLKNGDLTYEASGKTESMVVDGGVVQILQNKVLVLAEGVN